MDQDKPVSKALENQLTSDRLQLLKSRLAVAKAWSKKPHEAWKKWIAEYEIENFDDTAEIRDKVRIGYIFRKTETEIPAIFDDQPELFIKGKTEEFKDIESIYNSAYDRLWDKQNLEEKIEDVGVYFSLLGMGFISSPYLVKTKKVREMTDQPVMDEMGQPLVDPATGQPMIQQVPTEYEVPTYDMPKAEVIDPFKIYFSPETTFDTAMSSENCPYYITEKSWWKEKVKAVFNKDVEANEKMHTAEEGTDTQIDESVEKGTDIVSDDLKRVTVYEYYGTLPEDMAKGIEGSGWAWDREYHVYFTKNEVLLVEECPYSRYPLHVAGNYGMANKFWKFGDAKHLMPLVQELELYRSQILAHTRKMVNPKVLVDHATDINQDDFSDPRPGKVIKYTGEKPEYLSPANLGSEVGVGVDMVRTDLEKTAPSFDLAGGGGQSEVRSPRGIATYAEAADRGVRRKRKKIARLIRHLIIFQFQQIGMNWDETKTLEIEGKPEPVTPEVLQVLSDQELLEKVDIEIESLSVNKVQMREEALNLWDIAISAPNIFNIQAIAKDLLQSGFNKRDADRYMISMDAMNSTAIQGFIQQLAQQNPELANAVMQYVSQPNMQGLTDEQPNGMGPQGQAPQQPPPAADGLATPGDMGEMGAF